MGFDVHTHCLALVCPHGDTQTGKEVMPPQQGFFCFVLYFFSRELYERLDYCVCRPTREMGEMVFAVTLFKLSNFISHFMLFLGMNS